MHNSDYKDDGEILVDGDRADEEDNMEDSNLDGSDNEDDEDYEKDENGDFSDDFDDGQDGEDENGNTEAAVSVIMNNWVLYGSIGGSNHDNIRWIGSGRMEIIQNDIGLLLCVFYSPISVVYGIGLVPTLNMLMRHASGYAFTAVLDLKRCGRTPRHENISSIKSLTSGTKT